MLLGCVLCVLVQCVPCTLVTWLKITAALTPFIYYVMARETNDDVIISNEEIMSKWKGTAKAEKVENPKVLSDAVIQKLLHAGAVVRKMEGEQLFHIRIEFGDAAFRVYESWVSALPEEVDPHVLAIVAPAPSIVGTVLEPPLAIQTILQRECNALIHYYAPLRLADFATGAVPAIPPAAAVRVPIDVHHASFALSKIFEAIRAPPAVGYPTLTGLSAGSYICDVVQMWSNVDLTVVLFRC